MIIRIPRATAIAAALLALAVLLVACGGTPEPTAAPGTEQPPTAAVEPTAAPAETEPATPPQEDDLFPAQRPSAVRAQAAFEANCAACHGLDGDGSGFPGAADFTDVAFMRGKTPGGFFQAIRDGIADTAMPAWSDQLGDSEIWDAVYYAWAFATSPGEVATGETLFGESCVSCHGAEGDGSGLAGAADFTDQRFIASKSPGEFFQAVSEGIPDSAMPAWADTYRDDEIWAIVNYLWTFGYEYDGETAVEPTSEPTAEPSPEPTPETVLPQEPDPAVGAQLWPETPCIRCHGAQAEGDFGPRLTGSVLEFDEVLLRVRAGKGAMPAFSEQEVGDLQLRHIYAWLRSLAPPTPIPEPTETPKPDAPTPTPRAVLPPSGHLMAFWEHVNWVKVHSDFAKDASPTIEALHDRVRQARDRANGALQEADLAIADIPNQQAQATIRAVKGYVNEILGHANAALSTGDLDAARNEAAEMVKISRLDAWPSASLAVKQAGFTGSVRVRVRDQSGNPIPGALVTALTAPSPAAGITDDSGRVTINNLAAVRVMQVKAYDEGLVYHEVHVTVPTGGRADAEITLPGPPASGQAPVASNVSLSPSSGAGNGQVTFRMTGTDPQGHANIAEDQVFALNPELGTAYVLRSIGGDDWQTTVQLPNLPSGTHTWYFFIVDHQCNTSNIETRTYTVQ